MKVHFLPEPPDGFYAVLKNRVNDYFQTHKLSRYTDKASIFKSLLFTGLFAATYTIIITLELPLHLFLAAWFFMGIVMMFAAMSMVHDAAHGVYSRYPWVNQVLLHFANVCGTDGYIYKYKHSISHHAYTNIPGLDIDLEQSTMVRVTPFSRSMEKHRYQNTYMKLLYPFFVLFWILLRDFDYYFRKQIGPVEAHHATIHWVVLIAMKLIYITYILLIPYWVLAVPFWHILAGFFFMQIGSGVVAMFALLSNHVVEDSLFVVPDENGLIPCSWAEHQLRTTDDFSPDSLVVSYFFCGLNHHVAHHLFPNYHHTHYPAITKIVRSTAREFGLRYRYNSLVGGLLSHFRLLKKLSHERARARYA